MCFNRPSRQFPRKPKMQTVSKERERQDFQGHGALSWRPEVMRGATVGLGIAPQALRPDPGARPGASRDSPATAQSGAALAPPAPTPPHPRLPAPPSLPRHAERQLRGPAGYPMPRPKGPRGSGCESRAPLLPPPQVTLRPGQVWKPVTRVRIRGIGPKGVSYPLRL